MNQQKINCKEIFRNAYEKRYTWDKDFNGYEGKCILSSANQIHKGNFTIGKDYKPLIQNIDNEEVKKIIGSQLFEVSIHRVKREFQSIHSENSFNFLRNSKKGIEMIVSGKNNGDKYRVKDNFINMVYRKIHGIIIQIFVEEFLDTGTGFLSKKYTSQQFDPDTLNANSPKLEYVDQFENIGNKNIWLLNSRTIKYLNKNQEEEMQRFLFDDLSLLT